MNLKSATARAANAILSIAGSESARVATVSGCLSLSEELQRQRDQLEASPLFGGMQTEDVARQIKNLNHRARELRRVLLRRTFEEDSPRVGRDNDRELNAVSQDVKRIEGEWSLAAKTLTDASNRSADVKSRIELLQTEFADAKAEAVKKLEQIQDSLRAAFNGDANEEKERAAAKDLHQARAACELAGAETAVRIEFLTEQMGKLQEAEQTARNAFDQQRKKLSEARIQRQKIRSDIATKALVDVLISGLMELDDDLSKTTSIEQKQMRDAVVQALYFHGGHRLQAGESLIYSNKLTGMDDLIEAFRSEPDLDLLFGRKGMSATSGVSLVADSALT